MSALKTKLLENTEVVRLQPALESIRSNRNPMETFTNSDQFVAFRVSQGTMGHNRAANLNIYVKLNRLDEFILINHFRVQNKLFKLKPQVLMVDIWCSDLIHRELKS